jgi:hypothetical protein
MRHEDERKRHAPLLKIFPRARPGVDWRRIFDSAFLYGDFHDLISHARANIADNAGATSIATAALCSSAALASQGPGGGMGTASSLTQTVMAVLVYGISAIIVGAGLIGAVRRR